MQLIIRRFLFTGLESMKDMRHRIRLPWNIFMEEKAFHGTVFCNRQHIFLVKYAFHASADQARVEDEDMETAAGIPFCLIAVEDAGIDQESISGADRAGLCSDGKDGFPFHDNARFPFLVPVPAYMCLA